jgi:hypothetical protein
MKKNVLALSITAALVGLGFASGVQAVGLANNLAPSGADTSVLRASPNGIGHFLYVPYFSVQGGNHTMINIVNTDTSNAKAVKVRFRGAGNSDDLFDFQVFLSPGDVWTADVSQNAAGLAIMKTTDLSCTKPAKSSVVGDRLINDQAFNTIRMNNFRAGDLLANETREGYVEIFNMADIASGTSLWTAVKHPSRNTAPPCSGTAWTNLDVDSTIAQVSPPTTGLMANWIILNAVDAGAWSGAAAAIVATGGTQGSLTTPGHGNTVYFPQTNQPLGVTSTQIQTYTSDPWLITRPDYAMAYDLPDFSIPYTTLTTPGNQVAQLNSVIATSRIINEFLTTSAISATTDWVLSMPTRRYAVAYDYFSTSTTDKRVYTPATGTAYFTSVNTSVISQQICVGGATGSASGLTSVSYDQEEYTPTNPGSAVIISPVLPGQVTSFLICGEASVLAFNHGETASATGLITSASGSLKATVARSAIENGFGAGWTILNTPGAGAGGLPILGYAAYRAIGAVNAQGSAATFGATLPHRTNLVNP